MPTVKYPELKRLYETLGPRSAAAHLREALREGHLAPTDFSIRDLAEALIPDGREFVRMCDPANEGLNVMEANFAVDTSAFSNIAMQLVHSAIMAGYEQVPNIIAAAIPTMQTRLSGEKIPGVTNIGDAASIVNEGEDYPRAGVSEDWIELPPTVKRGFIVPITKEAIFFDRTGLLIERASKVGESMRTNEEKRAIDMLIDSATGVVNRHVLDHRYNWKGTAYATYAASGGHGVVNLKPSNTLVDWTDIDGSNQLFGNMKDPYTDEPINISAKTIITTPEMEMTARSILTATLWQVGDVTASAPVRVGPNLVAGYSLIVSPQLKARLAADSQATTHWYVGDMAKAFGHAVNWPITVVQAPPNSEDEFKRDIVVQYKASVRDAFFTKDPRYVIKNTVA